MRHLTNNANIVIIIIRTYLYKLSSYFNIDQYIIIYAIIFMKISSHSNYYHTNLHYLLQFQYDQINPNLNCTIFTNIYSNLKHILNY